MTGTVFDIQRFSVHDGPGIRTTVFMKGCPLRCRWCHNPEGLKKEIQVQFFKNECIGCGKCEGRHTLENTDICPSGALVKCGRETDEKELLSEVLKDRSFYRDSGGVTFSGGECLMQADFVAEMLGLIKNEGLHTAVDTCGCVPPESIMKTVENCDLYLYDIKCVDRETHIRYTGADNRIILENLRMLSETGKRIWIRTPVIPGFNDSYEEITKIAETVRSLKGIEKVTLMPYHTLGKSKYETLGYSPAYETDRQIGKEELNGFRRIFSDMNINID